MYIFKNQGSHDNHSVNTTLAPVLVKLHAYVSHCTLLNLW